MNFGKLSIENNKPKVIKTSFQILDVGSIFEYKDNVYMKVNCCKVVFSDYSLSEMHDVVLLRDGTLTSIPLTTMVTPLTAKLSVTSITH